MLAITFHHNVVMRGMVLCRDIFFRTDPELSATLAFFHTSAHTQERNCKFPSSHYQSTAVALFFLLWLWGRGLELTSLLCKGSKFSSQQERQALTLLFTSIPTQNFAVLQAYPNTQFMLISHIKLGRGQGWHAYRAVMFIRSMLIQRVDCIYMR